MASHGKLVLVIGPSGVGKSVILSALRTRHPELHFPKSATTRVRREGEGDDLYHFLSDAEFDEKLAHDAFLEWANVHVSARYGTLIEEIIPYIEEGKTVVREVDVQGFESIRKHPLFTGQYPLLSIFIAPESEQQLIDHIRSRAPISDEELSRRMESMRKEMAYAEKCDVIVTNAEGKLEEAIKKVEEALES